MFALVSSRELTILVNTSTLSLCALTSWLASLTISFIAPSLMSAHSVSHVSHQVKSITFRFSSLPPPCPSVMSHVSLCALCSTGIKVSAEMWDLNPSGVWTLNPFELYVIFNVVSDPSLPVSMYLTYHLLHTLADLSIESALSHPIALS